tara:strand:+ start:627 stop:1124 length:498 start_codon:yes stop_codon:yes gene_type:complete
MNSIGDFAENLILNQTKNIKEGKEVPPQMKSSGLAPAGKDISNIEVPDTFMREVLGESFHAQDAPVAEAIPEVVWTEADPEKPVQSLTEETAQQLVPLLEEVRELLREMCCGTTGSGSVGVNLGNPPKDTSVEKIEKKYGYLSSKPATSKKEILKRSIRNKLKRR